MSLIVEVRRVECVSNAIVSRASSSSPSPSRVVVGGGDGGSRGEDDARGVAPPRRKINHARSTRVDDGDDGVRVYARAGYITPYLSVVFARRDARVERRATHRRTDNGTTMADTNPNPRNLRDRRIADDDGADDDAERDGGAVARGDEKYMYVCE